MSRLKYAEREITLDYALKDIQEESLDEPRLYLVYLCGCTDCFPHAIFVSREKAEKWGVENSHNPEGWFIHTILLDKKEKVVYNNCNSCAGG